MHQSSYFMVHEQIDHTRSKYTVAAMKQAAWCEVLFRKVPTICNQKEGRKLPRGYH